MLCAAAWVTGSTTARLAVRCVAMVCRSSVAMVLRPGCSSGTRRVGNSNSRLSLYEGRKEGDVAVEVMRRR
jgi:hypothetical protein